jgi:transposase InsO family protein
MIAKGSNKKDRKNNKKVNKTKLAKNLGIGRSSIYYKPKLPDKDLILKKQIEEVLVEHKAYGHKRIALHLGINKKRVLRVMKLFDLSPIRTIKVPVKNKDLKQEEVDNDNLLNDLTINAPSQAWASDFTYLPYFNNKFLYLATIIDCYTKEIIAWNLSVRHSAKFIIEALNEAINKRKSPAIFHSDQGSEYKSKNLSKILKANKIKLSMSKKSSPWQNGFQESFYGKFKLELGHPKCYETVGELMEAIAGQIYYYNNKRIHTTIKCPPTVFYQRFQMVNMANLKSAVT